MLPKCLVALSLLASTVVAKGTYMPPLSDNVMEDLARRDVMDYETFALRDVETTGLQERGAPNGLNGLKTRCTKSHCLAYTFDDGPYNNMRKITDTAVENGIKATFFVNVSSQLSLPEGLSHFSTQVLNYDCIYNSKRVSDLRYAYSKGMQICSHTATHADLNTLSHKDIDFQIQKVEDALYKILGVVPACIRPPYGNANQDVVDYLNNRWGYVVVNWNFDTEDSLGKSVAYSKKVLRGIKSPKHAIVLMHETVDTTPTELFPAAIPIARDNGYKSSNMYTIPDSLGFNGYKVVGKRGSRDSTWTCDGLTPGQS